MKNSIKTQMRQALRAATMDYIQSTTKLVDWIDLAQSSPSVKIPTRVAAWRGACQAFPQDIAKGAEQAVDDYCGQVAEIIRAARAAQQALGEKRQREVGSPKFWQVLAAEYHAATQATHKKTQ